MNLSSNRIPVIAFVTALAAIFTSIQWSQAQPTCGFTEVTDNHVGAYRAAAEILTCLAVALGLLSLARRQWAVTLFCLIGPPLVFVGSGLHFCDD